MPDDRSGAPRRPHVRGTNGSHLSALPTSHVRFDEVSDEPVDLVAMQADDELIDALASGMSVSSPGYGGYGPDDQVVALLAAWKAEVDADPVRPLVDVEEAAARIRAAARPSGRRLRLVAPLAAAAVVVLSVGGIGYNAGTTAGPTDGLAWEIAKVVDGERVESVLAAERVQVRIAEAKDALSRGEPEMAREILAAAAEDLQVVRPEENAADLAEVQSFLEAKAAETPPGVPTRPDTPLASNPGRPVPQGATPGEPVRPEPVAEPVATTAPEPVVPVPVPSSAPEVGPGPAVVSPGTPPSEGSPATEVETTVEPSPSPVPTPPVDEGVDPAPSTDDSFGSSRPVGTPTASGTGTVDAVPDS